MPIFSLKKKTTRSYGNIGEKTETTFSSRWRRLNKKRIFIGLLLTAAGLFVAGTIVVLVISRDLPDPNRLNDRQVAESSKIYDRTGEHVLYEIYQEEKRTIVPIDQIAPLAVKATIAIEDKHFYEHSGVRVTSIMRASFNNLLGRTAGGGGASTLTQQLIKNTIGGTQRRGFAGLFRKIKEAILAMRLEKKYTKDEIIGLYLNQIPYGSVNYGIEAASRSYFHKSSKNLTLPEAATLAAIIQSPTRYLNNLPLLKGRRDTVLLLMQQQGFISEEEKTAAQATELDITPNAGIFAAEHFVLYVKQLLAEQFGETVDTAGLKVITSLDFEKQEIAEKIVKTQGDKFAASANANNASLVAIDPKTGQILSLVGSRDFANKEIDGQFNVAVLGKRQPGSSFKPFVFAAAFEKGYTPETVLYDIKTDFGNYKPGNYDGKEHGLVTMRKALQGSLNIPAVQTLYLVGVKNTIDFAKRFGYTTFTGDPGLSLVLGGAEVNLLEHTNAYATLANNGTYHPTVAILKVTDPKGNVLYEWKETPGTEALKPETTATITNVLTDDAARAYIFGRGGTLTLPGRKVAAKTGTTNDSKDAWTMGYVPSLAAGVWVGNTIPSPMKGGGNTLAGAIWNQFMRAALASTTPENFPSPPANTAEKAVLRGSDGGIKLPINNLTGRIATSSTPPELIVEKTFLPPHTILYYVNKDDPRGPAPTNPENDPQFSIWEAALQDWVLRLQAAGKPVTLEEPPTETDDTTSPELAPTIDIGSPANNTTFTDRTIVISVKATAPRGIARVEYFIDNQSVGKSSNPPFELSYYAKTLPRGTHTFKVIASDDQGNAASAVSTFTLDAELDPPNVDWFDSSPLTLAQADFPRVMNLTPFRWEETANIKIYLSSGSDKKQIYEFKPGEDKLFAGQLSFTWKNSSGPGEYTLSAILTAKSGATTQKDLQITVQ